MTSETENETQTHIYSIGDSRRPRPTTSPINLTLQSHLLRSNHRLRARLRTNITSPKQLLPPANTFKHKQTHLTVIHPQTKSLLGYISIPRLRHLLETQQVSDADPVEKAMTRFQRKGRRYRLITMETRLEELEAFFAGSETGEKQDFAVVTDPARRFVLGVATRGDLEEFVRRRPG